MPKGFLVIISGPSGSGKSTIVRKLRQRDPSLRYSVSCSTRPPRPSELDGTHYHFLSVPQFRQRARAGELLEWAEVHGNLYGTPRRPIETAVRAGEVILLAIDVKGAETIGRKRRDAVTIFLLPPTLEALKRRLQLRRDTRDALRTRLANARGELAHAKRYRYWVVNDSLPEAVAQIESIIEAERLRSQRHALEGTRLAGLVR